jgi:hypothetical protein
VKQLKSRDADYVFALSAQEKELMLKLFEHFPQVPVAHHRLSQAADSSGTGENQGLLEESLKAHQSRDRAWLATSFQGAPRFQAVESGFHLRLEREEMERLLQIFNDVRVGSWLALKSPDLGGKKNLKVTRLTAPFIQRMELAGIFEMILLRALQGPGGGG